MSEIPRENKLTSGKSNEGKIRIAMNMGQKILPVIFILIICLSITLAYSSLFAETISYFRYHIVKRGETLYEISERYEISEYYEVPWREIKERNNLSGDEIYPGQKLIIPVKVQGVYHTVKKYENLYRISKAYRVSQEEICRLNHISDPTQIKIDQRLFIPGAKEVREIDVSDLKKERGKDFPEETIPASEQMVTLPESINTAQNSKEEEAFVEKMAPSLIWPLKGEIIRYFGEGNSGIDISAPEESIIVAPADGKVYHSGWSKSLGWTLIIEHSQLGIWTVYTHNSLNLVEFGDVVDRGDLIAKIGSTGWVECTVLHFEVRRNDGKSVNPLDYLP